jgi:hypothetical protein
MAKDEPRHAKILARGVRTAGDCQSLLEALVGDVVNHHVTPEQATTIIHDAMPPGLAEAFDRFFSEKPE